MDQQTLQDQLVALATTIHQLKDDVSTEEATKHAMVMPFIQTLGYNVFDPQEVVPEYTADVGVKKHEKVDYAIIKNDQPIILIECKCHNDNLKKHHKSQLFRYFASTSARIGILTNGIEYHIFSDLDKINTMDHRPFFKFQLDTKDNLDAKVVRFLLKVTKKNFDVQNLTALAQQMHYKNKLVQYLNDQTTQPAAPFVKFLCAEIYQLPKIKKHLQELTPAIQQALKDFADTTLKEKLKEVESMLKYKGGSQLAETPSCESKAVVTTEEELEAFYIVRAILAEWISPTRVTHRDNQSYFPIFLDNNNQKLICRLYLTPTKRDVVFVSAGRQERHAMESIEDLYKYKAKFKQKVSMIEAKRTAKQDQPTENAVPKLELLSSWITTGRNRTSRSRIARNEGSWCLHD